MIVQFFVFPYIANRYGVLNCLKVSSLGFPIAYALIPFTALFPTNTLRQTAAFILMCGKLACVVFAFPCCTILLTNSAPSVQVLGTLNGMATSVGAIGRALGPALIGAAFSIGVKLGFMIFPWWLLALISLLSAIPVFWMIETDGFAGASSDVDEDSEDDEFYDNDDVNNDIEYHDGTPAEYDGLIEHVDSKAIDAATTGTSQVIVERPIPDDDGRSVENLIDNSSLIDNPPPNVSSNSRFLEQ